MNKADQDQVDPAMEMENLEHAVTEMAETASNLNYWSGLIVQVPLEYFPSLCQISF